MFLRGLEFFITKKSNLYIKNFTFEKVFCHWLKVINIYNYNCTLKFLYVQTVLWTDNIDIWPFCVRRLFFGIFEPVIFIFVSSFCFTYILCNSKEVQKPVFVCCKPYFLWLGWTCFCFADAVFHGCGLCARLFYWQIPL